MEKITFVEGIEVALVAMSVVFLILIIMMIILGSFKYIGKLQKKPEVKKQSSPVKSRNMLNLSDEDMVVACLIATIDASEEYGCELRVVNVKEIGRI
ncbi:MAG: OadG family transporter subunit [Bacilli bacterium]